MKETSGDAEIESEQQREQLEFRRLSISSQEARLKLQPLDWTSVALLAITIIAAPVIGANFATPPHSVPGIPDDAGSLLSLIGAPLLCILISLALGALLWREFKRPVAIGAVTGLAGAFALLGIWAGISALFGKATWLSLNALMALYAALLAGWMASRLGRNVQAIASLTLAIVFAGSVAAAFALNEYMTYRVIVEGHAAFDPSHRVLGTFFNGDFLAGYLLLALPVTLTVFISSRQRLFQLAAGIGLLMQSAALLLTGSRGGVAVAAISIAILLCLVLASGSLKEHLKMVAAAGILILLGAFLGRTPTLSRVSTQESPDKSGANIASGVKSASDAQAHSGEFRKYNWIGTINMTAKNPIFGTGIGTYHIAYPKYAVTDFTFQAHNGYLQLASETGFPGILFFLAGVAAATAFAAHNLFLNPKTITRNESSADEDDPLELETSQRAISLESPKLAVCGLLASVAGLMIHSLLDSNWYLIATLLTFGIVMGLLVAVARHIAPLSTHTPKIVGKEFGFIGLSLVAFLLWRGNSTLQDRLNTSAASTASSAESAVESVKAASGFDPFDPEPHLYLSQLLRQNPAESLAELQKATELSPSGRTFYLLGKFHSAKKEWNEAEGAFVKSRFHDPNNLQTLRALAESYRNAGKNLEASETYRIMTALESSTYGKVRAMPELQEMDFAFAHAGLADLAFLQSNWKSAYDEYSIARGQIRSYWGGRHGYYDQVRSPEKRVAYQKLYLRVLDQLAETCKKLNTLEPIESIKIEKTQVDVDIEKDQSAEVLK